MPLCKFKSGPGVSPLLSSRRGGQGRSLSLIVGSSLPMKRTIDTPPDPSVTKRPRVSGPSDLASLARLPPSPPRTSTKRRRSGQPMPSPTGPFAIRAIGPKGPVDLDYVPGMDAHDFAKFNLERHAVQLDAPRHYDSLYGLLLVQFTAVVLPAVLQNSRTSRENVPTAASQIEHTGPTTPPAKRQCVRPLTEQYATSNTPIQPAPFLHSATPDGISSASVNFADVVDDTAMEELVFAEQSHEPC